MTFVPPALEVEVERSPAVKDEMLIGSLNVAVKLMGEAFVGSACPAAWTRVIVGASRSTVQLSGKPLAVVAMLPVVSVAANPPDSATLVVPVKPEEMPVATTIVQVVEFVC